MEVVKTIYMCKPILIVDESVRSLFEYATRAMIENSERLCVTTFLESS